MISALLLGLFGSLHCLGMCGPIAMALPLDRRNALTAASGAFLYNGGRILGYASMGILLGKLGQTLAIIDISRWVSVTTGVVIIIYILYRYTPLFGTYRAGSAILGWSRLNGFISEQFGRTSYEGNFLIGLMNAFLPCGFVYIALAAAINTSSPLEGATYMALFGIGTAPLMLSVNLAGAKLRSKLFSPRIIPYILGLFAVLFIVRGLALDIPFLSPDINTTVGFIHSCLP